MKNYVRLGHHIPQRIVIFRALQLGDLLCAVPAFRALRAALPDAEITLVSLPWARNFVDRFDVYLDDFLEFPGFPGFPEQRSHVHRLPQFLSEVQWLSYDLALQMQGSGGIANSLIELFGARLTAGFYLPGQYCPDENLFLEYPEGEPEILRHLRLMEFLGFPLQGDTLEFPLSERDWMDFDALREQYGLQMGRYACVHPGSRSVDRRWPPDRFAAIAEGLVERGFQVVLTGTQDEAQITRAVAALSRAPLIDLAGKTSLGAVGALVSGAGLVVCNDTGISHLAAALCTPSVVLFSSSDPQRWAPLNRRMHRVVEDATRLTPEGVLVEVDELLAIGYFYAR